MNLSAEQQQALELLVSSGRCTSEDLQKFTEQELQAIATSTMEYLETGESLLIKEIEATDYEYEVPDVQTMVENPFYLGRELGYIDNTGRRQLYDFWMDKLIEVEQGNYFEVLITGGIGLGKTTFMNLLFARDLLKLVALKNPQRHYNLAPSTTIVLAFFNILKDLSQDVGYAGFQGMLENSPFFQKALTRNNRLKPGFQMHPPATKRIQFTVGSRVQHTLGLAVFGAQLDEANFGQDSYDRQDEEKKSQVYENYTSLKSRKASRFIKAAGHFMVGSSKKSTSDFLEQHIEKSKGKPGVLVIDAPQYVVKACRGDYSGKTFRVLLGDITREPRILKDEESIPEALATQVETIPVEFKEQYETNIIEALRDVSGKAMERTMAFIVNREALRQNINLERRAPWNFTVRPKAPPNTIEISMHGPDQIQDFLIKEVLFCNKGKLMHEDNSRFLAIDTGYSQDALGMAMVCKSGVRVLKKEEGTVFLPKYSMDFVIRIKGAEGQNYPLFKTREFIKYLVKSCGIYIGGVATDGFQSVQLQQEILHEFPFMKVEQLSVDRDDLAYLSFRTILENGCLDIYDDTNLKVELFDLRHLVTGSRGKVMQMISRIVDHPRVASDGFVGRKDVADALCNATLMCQKYDNSISKEEMKETLEEIKALNLDSITKDAQQAVERALKEIEGFDLNSLIKGS